MVGLEDLAMLDTQIWMRSGEITAQRLHCAQSTVSRRNADTLRRLGLSMQRDEGEWQLQGDQQLLLMERAVHQLHRLRLASDSSLRLEANFWAGPQLAQPLPESWIGGCWDHVGMHRPLQLLRERVIDAWIGSYQPDLPDSTDPDLVVIDLCRAPVYLIADAQHPLSGRSDLTRLDLDPYPSLALPAGLFPKTEQTLRGLGLWSSEARMKRYKPEAWQGRTQDQVTLSYATPLALAMMPGLVRLDFDLGLISGESLVIRRDVVEERAVQVLLTTLRERIEQLAKRHADLIPISSSAAQT